jgi:cold shock CspA family protein
MIKSGHIKMIFQNKSGYLAGFIIPDDGSQDIYFSEHHVDEVLLSKIAVKQHVKVELETGADRLYAIYVWQDDNG